MSSLICFTGFAPDQPIDVAVSDPDGRVQRQQILSDIQSDTQTDFYLIWRAIPGDPLGAYQIVATQGARQASGSFTLGLSSKPQIFTLDPSAGVPGATFNFGLAGFQPNQPVPLYLYRPGTCSNSGNTQCEIYLIDLPASQVDERGEAIYSLRTASDFPAGRYEVVHTQGDLSHPQATNLALFVVGRSSRTSYNAPIWAPDGSKIAFGSAKPAEGRAIYVINADGSGQIKLVDRVSPDSIAWSPNSSQLAFVLSVDNNVEVFTINADGSELTNLTQNPAPDNSPAWSPDGSQIAFISIRQDGMGLFVMNADGSNQRQLTTGTYRRLAWSPDGSRLALADGTNIYMINADGTGFVKLTNDPMIERIEGLAVSPDGNKIAFAASEPHMPARNIYVINADGSELIALADKTADASTPVWSPDGSKMAFVSGRDTNYEIYVSAADGSGLTNLTQNDAADTNPAWSPDGSRIVFVSDRDGSQAIYMMNADGSDSRQLVGGQ